MVEHTPGPWHVERGQSLADGTHACDVMAPDLDINANKGDLIVIASYITPANAALIVRAVNAHDDLLAAAEQVIAWAEACDGNLDTPQGDDALAKLQTAINKAKGA